MSLAGKKIHFMGAGGIGVSAMAMMAKNNGAAVTACDKNKNEMTSLLESKGINVYDSHAPSHVNGMDLLVYTSAVPKDHPERTAAKSAVSRGAFLAELMEGKEAWGVAGTHGKTTTSWFLANIAMHAGLDPSVFIGGTTEGLEGRNHRIGTGPFVAELDESDGSFLLPRLDAAVLTNIESDHLSHYGDDKALIDAFKKYAAGVEEKGLLAANADNPECMDIYRKHRGNKISFGCGMNADLAAVTTRFRDGGGMTFDVVYRGRDAGRFEIRMTGVHNVSNALGAMAVALERGVDADVVREALAETNGVGRRMERLGTCAGAILYSDYAHHPTEVEAAITAFRSMHPGKTLVVFQPHLYSRTRDYADAFAKALGNADAVLLLDIYPAREAPLPGVTSEMVAEKMRLAGKDVAGPVSLEKAVTETERLAAGCEALVMMGAGDIDSVARSLARAT